jgi:hypothetical protein
MLLLFLFSLALLVLQIQAQGTILVGTRTTVSTSADASLSYISYSTTVTVPTTSTYDGNLTTLTTQVNGTAIATATFLSGTRGEPNATGTSTSTQPTNTTPCNGYAEFCNRKYSNITMVAAHNSPFVQPNNVAANQDYGVIAQLNDGIRMVTGETQFNGAVMHYCHTSCNLLDAGPAELVFANITAWLNAHPFEVVTVLIVNSKYVPVTSYVPAITNSGLLKLAYTPPIIPMGLNDWPTLGDLILSNKRALIFMDYQANQTAVPYVMDQFSQLWETPFSPTDPTFPCTEQRPPGISKIQAESRMYLANHNLNTRIQAFGLDILVPDTVALNTTNAISGPSSLGQASSDCVASWDRPPNFLLVDYYNVGSGSVFEVAAKANNVTYTNKPCCGLNADVSSVGTTVCTNGASLVVFVALVVGFMMV